MKTTIIEHREIAPNCMYLRVEAPELVLKAVPGQFVHVQCSTSYDPLLRRPLGIHEADPHAGTFSMLYEIRGRGTSLLAERCIGDTVDILGPLGNGFALPESCDQPVLLISGGIGVAPLYFLASKLSREALCKDMTCIIGARTESMLLRVDEFKQYTQDVRISTDDGSAGCHGFVTTPLSQYIEEMDKNNPPVVYACGPMPMLRAITDVTKSYGLKCWISTEAKMACGVGACMSCVIKVRTAPGESDADFKYIRSCKEGPVFDADEVIWD
ncbi:MAG: dihydroorotate dehydrogenase electron transfer subunit [Armatimonadota bacterium]